MNLAQADQRFPKVHRFHMRVHTGQRDLIDSSYECRYMSATKLLLLPQSSLYSNEFPDNIIHQRGDVVWFGKA